VEWAKTRNPLSKYDSFIHTESAAASLNHAPNSDFVFAYVMH
jgi:hypothetical protein